MSLPYSDAFFVTAYPRECTETFQAGPQTTFEFFGGVPTKMRYDNTSVAVKKVLGSRDRELTREFLRLESHFLFTHRFCRVARGNEKGHRRGPRWFGRRNFLVPVPRSTRSPNSTCTWPALCFDELFRRVRGNAETKRNASRPTARRCSGSRRDVRIAQGQPRQVQLFVPGAL